MIIDDAKDASLNASAIKTTLKSLLYDDARRNLMTTAVYPTPLTLPSTSPLGRVFQRR